MRTNVAKKFPPVLTHEGAPAVRINPKFELRRSVLSCLLWEDGFYESGKTVAKRIEEMIPLVPADFAADLAIEARLLHNLRHVPLHIAVAMCRAGGDYRYAVRSVLPAVIRRADELSEFLAMYWKDGKVPLAKSVKVGLARAFPKFNEYQLAKYNRDNTVKLRDVLFLCHAKPGAPGPDEEKDFSVVTVKGTKHRGQVFRHLSGQGALWTKLVEGKLETPDTWEVGLSACKSKAERQLLWERLLREKKLGALALLRNLRNMQQDAVATGYLREALSSADYSRVLPFRFIAAARTNPGLEPLIEEAMLKSMTPEEKIIGSTCILVDVSGSMTSPLSKKSDLMAIDAACGMAMIAREMFEEVDVFSFSNTLVQVPARRGFALRDAIVKSQPNSGTYLGNAIAAVQKRNRYIRLIVVTDEQSHDRVPDPQVLGYMVNVQPNKNGVGYGKWVHVDGFSEAVMKWIGEYEKLDKNEK